MFVPTTEKEIPTKGDEMALTQETANHWNYFIALEDDLAEISRYIEFSEHNYKTYSIELAHLLLAAASEVEVVLKAICEKIDPDGSHESAKKLREVIQDKQSYMIREFCTIPRFGLKFQPWKEWDNKNAVRPFWWTAYNDVKHERGQKFENANLENVLNAMSALAIANLYLQRNYTRWPRGSIGHMSRVVLNLGPEPSLLQFNRDYYHIIPGN